MAERSDDDDADVSVRPDLARQLRDLADRVDDLEPAQIAGQLEALKMEVVLSTIAATANTTNDPPDELIDDVREIARITRYSISWVRKNGHTLPGFRQPGGKGTRVAWSRRALEEWATQPTS